MKPTLALLATLLATLPVPPAWAADDASLRRCRVIADDKARLACFDALVPVPSPTAPPPAQPTQPKAEAPAPVPAAAPAPAAAPGFGLVRPVEQPETLTTTFPGTFTGWEPRQRLQLANGQVWQVDDNSRGAYHLREPKVKVRRTAFGGFMMEIEGVTSLIRVRRVE